jgi:acyl-CoA thioesterase FadM
VTASGRTLHAAVTPDGRPTRLPERVKELFR